MFFQLLPDAFPALAAAHFAALASPGPDFFLILGHAARHKAKGAFFICCGVAFGSGCYIALAILGWSGFKTAPILHRLVEGAGAAWLLYLGVKLIQSASSAHKLEPKPPLSFWGQFCAGLGSALLNPKNALFYLTLMTAVIGSDATLLQQSMAGIWMAALVLIWDCSLVCLIARPRIQALILSKIPMIERFSGAALLIVAAWLLVRVFNP